MFIDKSILYILAIFLLGSCQSKQNKEQASTDEQNVLTGKYTGSLNTQGQQIPLTFELSQNPKQFILKNGPETFVIDSFYWQGDSINVPLHIFDTRLSARHTSKGLQGFWIKNYVDNYKVPFVAQKSKSISTTTNSSSNPSKTVKLANRYSVYFSSMLEDSTVSVGKFTQDGNKVHGTFLTETGDYRYLVGDIKNQKLRLSTFDGEHAFLFIADVKEDGKLDGHFWSGKTWHETFEAYPDSLAQLPSADSLTFLKEGYNEFTFIGQNLYGKTLTHESDEFQNKALIIQIMGSWCPNCMDETEYLAKWYHTQKPDSLEIVALAFERKNDFDYAKKRLEVMKLRYDIDYPLLFAGLYQKDSAAFKLPALNQVVAYPTLVLLDKNHDVKYIHTGFNGPGTGEAFERWKLKFNKKVKELL